MKNTFRFLMLIFASFCFQMCTVKPDGQWKSVNTNLELNFNDKWELIIPNIDTNNKTLVGIKDNLDDSSLTVKITEDVPKEQFSDALYFSNIIDQMLNVNSKNKLLLEDNIEFKKTEYHRMIFFMKTKYGEMIQTVYTCRNGEKAIGIQFTYPKNLTDNPAEVIPPKINKVLNEMKI